MVGPRVLRVVTIAWASFLPAALGAVLFFAAFDPAELALHATFPVELSAMAGYGVGFLGFWAMTALAAWLAVLLADHS